MNVDQIAKLEAEFSVRFPREYCQTLLAYPYPDSEEFTTDFTVLADFNHGLRADRSPWGFQWEDHFWWVGADGAGGFYFINCQEDGCRVYYLDHEDPAESFSDQTRLKPRSLSDVMLERKQFWAEFEEERQRLLKRIASRRWWQFWIPRSPPLWAQDKPDSS